MTFEDLLKKQRLEAEARGYRMADMNKTKEEVNRRRRSWAHCFDTYIEHLIYDDSNRPAPQIIRIAADLADARQDELDRRFPEGVDIEE